MKPAEQSRQFDAETDSDAVPLLPIIDQDECVDSHSIFSSLFERIVQGYALTLGEDTEESEASLEILLDAVHEAVLILESDGTIVMANQAFYSTFGYDRAATTGVRLDSFITDGYRPQLRSALASFSDNAMAAEQHKHGSVLAVRARRPDGTELSMDCLLSSIRVHGKSAVIALMRDLSFDHELFEQLRETRDHYVALSETITEAILRIDENFTILFANSGLRNTFGWEKEDVIGKPMAMLFPPSGFEKHRNDFLKYFYIDDADRPAMGLSRTIEFLGATKNRGVAPMELSFGNSKDHQGRTLTCVIHDISQQKTLERRLRHLAYHDKLTGLGNRDLFGEDIRHALETITATPDAKAALLFLDLDGFKHVNDTIGHDAGDALLIEAARRIRVSLREGDSAYRFGGDEFVVLLPSIRMPEDCIAVGERIRIAISQPYMLATQDGRKDTKAEVGVSVGMAIMPDHGNSMEDITKRADLAMYSSKEAGKNRCTMYSASLSSKSFERRQLEGAIKAALSDNQFSLVYQPIMDRMGKVCGLEALVRWNKPDGTSIAPSVFIPAAEETGLFPQLGNRILSEALGDLSRIHRRGYDVFMSVNIATRQFGQPGFEDCVTSAVRASGIDPSRLKLELTEATIIHDVARTTGLLSSLRKRLPGISFMLDDFGTGFSSPALLASLPVDRLKIDLSFVQDYDGQSTAKVVRAILQMASSLGIRTMAEGIETSAQRDFFIQNGCDELQGYYFSKPLPVEDVYRFIVTINGVSDR